jgi:hypothetical protein
MNKTRKLVFFSGTCYLGILSTRIEGRFIFKNTVGKARANEYFSESS